MPTPAGDQPLTCLRCKRPVHDVNGDLLTVDTGAVDCSGRVDVEHVTSAHRVLNPDGYTCTFATAETTRAFAQREADSHGVDQLIEEWSPRFDDDLNQGWALVGVAKPSITL